MTGSRSRRRSFPRKKVKKAAEVAEVKTSKRPGKKATKPAAHAHAKKAAPKKKAAAKKKKK